MLSPIYLVLQILFQVMAIHVVNVVASLACWSASSVFLVSAYSMAEDSTPWCRKFVHPCLVSFLPLCFGGGTGTITVPVPLGWYSVHPPLQGVGPSHSPKTFQISWLVAWPRAAPDGVGSRDAAWGHVMPL